MMNSGSTIKLLHSLLKCYRIYRDCNTISQIYTKHPLTDSIRSLSDTLDELGVQHDVYKITIDDIVDMSTPVLAPVSTLNSSYVIINGIHDGNVRIISHDKEKEVAFEDFIKIWNGYVLIVQSSEDKYSERTLAYYIGQLVWFLKKNSSYCICSALILLMSLSLKTNNWGNALIFITSMLGAIVSVSAYLKENADGNPLKRLCKFNGRDICKEAISSSEAKLWRHISLADLSLSYFITMIFMMFTSYYSPGAVLMFPILSIAFVTYSVIWMIINQKVCSLCLIIDLMLIIQTVLAIISYDKIIITPMTFVYVIIYFITYLCLIKLKELLKGKYDVQSLKQIKRFLISDTDLFWNLARRQPCLIAKVPDDVISNNIEKAENTILSVINPNCLFCRDIHNKLLKLVDYKIEFIFVTRESDLESKRVAAYILEQFHEKQLSWTKVNELIDNYYQDPTISRLWQPQDRYYNMLNDHRAFCIKNKITSTPTILVNGYRIPEPYEITDIEYIL